MTVLGTSILKDLMSKYKVIYPSDPGAFDGDGYVLTARASFSSWIPPT